MELRMQAAAPESRLSRILSPEGIVAPFRAGTPVEAFQLLLGPLLRIEGFTDRETEAALEAIRNRERAGSTIVGDVALPHARIAGLTRIVASLGLNADGVFEAGPAGTHVVLAFASPEKAPVEHLRFLAQVAQVFRAEDVVAALLAASSPEAILEVLRSREK
jgi:mannitol/fructose-specific phosphotransferase system IIA component (Ntr-type)